MKELVTLRQFIKSEKQNFDGYTIKFGKVKFDGFISTLGGLEHTIWFNGKQVYEWKKLDISEKRLRFLMTCAKCGFDICSECYHPIFESTAEHWFAGCYHKKCWTKEMEAQRKLDYENLD